MISAVVLTKNEEKNIVDCLETLVWCDEIIVVDDYSEDRTIEVIRSLKTQKIRVVRRKLNNDFAAQRNFGLSKAKGYWILFIDVDERVSPQLAEEIKRATSVSAQKYNGYYLKRRDSMWGRELKYGETGDIRLLRLARKDKGIWIHNVHEAWKVKGKIGALKHPLLHYPHATVSEFLREVNWYARIRSAELLKSGETVALWHILFYPIAKFVHNYVLKLGFLDGVHGFVYAAMMSFHSFLVRATLWLQENRKRER